MGKVNYLYASDNNFAKVLGVSLFSLLINNKENVNKVFIISQNISKENKEKILDIEKKLNVNNVIEFVNMPDIDKIIGEKVDIKRYSISMFSRIMIDTVLPRDITKIIYLDCDTIIKNNLIDLWNVELEGKIIGAVNDYRSIYYQKNLGIKKENCYINSGVLLIDLDKYRKENMEGKLLDAIKKYNGILEFPDNDVICKVAQDQIKLLPLKYNITSVFFMTNYYELLKLRKPNKIDKKEIYENAITNPMIIHFTTCFLMKGRPWLKGCNHPFTSEYLELYKQTPWKDEELLKEKMNISKKIKQLIVKITPRCILISVCGLLHAYLKPFGQRKRLRIVRENVEEE